jgi:large subunit ribosomal protein L13
MTTTIPGAKTAGRSWLLVDAKDQVLGRLASRIATILRGKHKPSYTPFLDTGDFVVVVNAEQIALTGQKRVQKTYQRYSGYPGGRRERTIAQVLSTHPDRVLRQAVKGMMPDGPLARRLMGKLKIYAGPAHPHAAQQPQPASAALIGGSPSHG